jgi:hypothetical protein
MSQSTAAPLFTKTQAVEPVSSGLEHSKKIGQPAIIDAPFLLRFPSVPIHPFRKQRIVLTVLYGSPQHSA